MAAIRDILQAKITQPLMTRYCQRRAWSDELSSAIGKRGLQLDWVKLWIRWYLFKKVSCPDYNAPRASGLRARSSWRPSPHVRRWAGIRRGLSRTSLRSSGGTVQPPSSARRRCCQRVEPKYPATVCGGTGIQSHSGVTDAVCDCPVCMEAGCMVDAGASAKTLGSTSP